MATFSTHAPQLYGSVKTSLVLIYRIGRHVRTIADPTERMHSLILLNAAWLKVFEDSQLPAASFVLIDKSIRKIVAAGEDTRLAISDAMAVTMLHDPPPYLKGIFYGNRQP